MPSHTKDMTQGNPTKLILQFSLPLLAGNILQQLYNLVDTLVVGRAEGVTALAAVSSTGWLDWTLLGLILGLAQGFSDISIKFFSHVLLLHDSLTSVPDGQKFSYISSMTACMSSLLIPLQIAWATTILKLWLIFSISASLFSISTWITAPFRRSRIRYPSLLNMA
jgi:O-antigen/teichoic acid export membrane protein